MIARRRLLQTLGASLLLTSLGHRGAVATPANTPIRIGLTPVFIDDQVSFLTAWRDYLSQVLGRPVEFVQRASYREVVELIRQETLLFAWLCGYPYVRGQRWMRLLAVPVYQGQPLYQSYIIVPARDQLSTTITDLRQRIFAYSDPDSNSGYLYAQYRLATTGFRAANFFRRTFFTYSHKKVVEAVALGIAQGGAVDGYVWDTLARTHPELTEATRIIERSPRFGFPPLVAAQSVSGTLFEQVQSALLNMAADPAAQPFLAQLNLDRFMQPPPNLYDGIARMVDVVGEPLS